MSDNVKRIDEAKEQAEVKPEAGKSAAAERLEKAREKFSEVAGGVEKGVKGLGETAGRAKQQVKEGAERATVVARDKYDVAAEKVRVGYDKAKKDLDHLSQDLNEYVRDNPGKAVLIAAGLGFLVGLLLRGGGGRR
ncbi:MAG: hypothetical protein V3R89_00700 [Thermoanaerobaculia bacterium]